eukprot:gene15559-biopygen5201
MILHASAWGKRQRTRTGRGPDAGRTLEFEQTDADRTRATGQGRTEQNRAEQSSTGPDRTGQGMAAPPAPARLRAPPAPAGVPARASGASGAGSLAPPAPARRRLRRRLAEPAGHLGRSPWGTTMLAAGENQDRG